MQLKRVVVTGMGALTPIGNNLEAYWEGLRTGKSGFCPHYIFRYRKIQDQVRMRAQRVRPNGFLR